MSVVVGESNTGYEFDECKIEIITDFSVFLTFFDEFVCSVLLVFWCCCLGGLLESAKSKKRDQRNKSSAIKMKRKMEIKNK